MQKMKQWETKYQPCLLEIFDGKLYYAEYFLSSGAYNFHGYITTFMKSTIFLSYIYNYLQREGLLSSQLDTEFSYILSQYKLVITSPSSRFLDDNAMEAMENVFISYAYFSHFISTSYYCIEKGYDEHNLDKPVVDFIKTYCKDMDEVDTIIWHDSSLIYAYHYIISKYLDIYKTISGYSKIDEEIKAIRNAILADMNISTGEFYKPKEIIVDDERKVYYIAKHHSENLCDYIMFEEHLLIIFLAILNYNCEYIVTYVLDYLEENNQSDKWLELLASNFVYF